MKKYILLLFTAFLLLSSDVFALRSKKDYFLKPQVGLWFGPITPIYTTHEDVDTNLGGGLYFRYNTPFRYLKFGIDGSYQHFESDNDNRLYLIPIYGNFVFLLPLNLPVRFQFKAGAGATYVHMKPDDVRQVDPTFMLGWEFSFPAGRVVNIGLRIDYLQIYEKHIDGANKNGHIINSGITLYFNI